MHDREQAANNLAAVQMELDDLASDLLKGETPPDLDSRQHLLIPALLGPRKSAGLFCELKGHVSHSASTNFYFKYGAHIS